VTTDDTQVKAGRPAAPPLDRAVIILGLIIICGQIMAVLDMTVRLVS
jgi:hypothetical protein